MQVENGSFGCGNTALCSAAAASIGGVVIQFLSEDGHPGNVPNVTIDSIDISGEDAKHIWIEIIEYGFHSVDLRLDSC